MALGPMGQRVKGSGVQGTASPERERIACFEVD